MRWWSQPHHSFASKKSIGLTENGGRYREVDVYFLILLEGSYRNLYDEREIGSTSPSYRSGIKLNWIPHLLPTKSARTLKLLHKSIGHKSWYHGPIRNPDRGCYAEHRTIEDPYSSSCALSEHRPLHSTAAVLRRLGPLGAK